MTISNVTAGALIDPAWGNSVADLLNEYTDDAWIALTPAAGFGASGGADMALAYKVIGNIVFIAGAVERTGGNVGSGAPTIVATVPGAITPSTDQTNGSAIIPQSPGSPCRLAQIRADGGLRAYGAFNTGDDIAIQLHYPLA